MAVWLAELDPLRFLWANRKGIELWQTWDLEDLRQRDLWFQEQDVAGAVLEVGPDKELYRAAVSSRASGELRFYNLEARKATALSWQGGPGSRCSGPPRAPRCAPDRVRQRQR